MTPLLIRADANVQIGTGHVMRCLALAQAWQQAGGRAFLATTMTTPAFANRLETEEVETVHLTIASDSLEDAEQTIAVAHQIGAVWVVVDGYHFTTAYQQALKAANLKLLWIDDYGHADHYYADLVLNQNICANKSLYTHCEHDTRLLLGPRYALLRREFWPWRGWQREIPAVARKLLVTLGGSDPDNVTLKVIQALSQVQIEGLETVVIVGSSNPHWEVLCSAVGDVKSTIHLERDVTHVPELMAWADLAISAGGSTCWELAFMGLPNLTLILADNQQAIAEGLDAAGVSCNLGHPNVLASTSLVNKLTELTCAPEQRLTRSRHGQELVDGAGTTRVVSAMQSHRLTLRPAQADDCHLIWEWANDPMSRSVSFSSEPIPWEHHVSWFTSKLNDPRTLFYLALDADKRPIGQIRYQIEGPEAVVSINLAPNQTGQGYGSEIIWQASQCVFEQTAINLIHAYIKPDNTASIRAFTKAGFVKNDVTQVQEHLALHFVLRKDEPQ